MNFSETQLKSKYTNLFICNGQGGWFCVKDGIFLGIVAVYKTIEECENWVKNYRKVISIV